MQPATIQSPPAEVRNPGRRFRNRTTRNLLTLVAIYALMFIVAVIVIFPIYWMFTISLKLPREIYRIPALFPENPTWENYRVLIDEKGYLTNIRNSIIVASSVTVVSLLISSFAAYSIVRFRYRFRGLVGRIILLTYLTPGSLLFIPLSIIVARLHMGNSLWGLIVLYLTFSIPLSTWLLSGYFRSVPADLEEQAMVDGTTQLGALFRILLPLSLPGLAAVGIFTFTAAWNELLFALIFITSEEKRTVPLGLQYLITGDVLLWGPIMAGAVLAALPVMLLYFVAQRFMVQGITAGSVKG
jgi:multiple sugar transport system permease protein